ncbi:hypothetical protein OAL49_06635 [Gammaproteobacteria bacterium]|jgi:type IV secretory pathway component VirB8|nr:hypothetical protein [Gammaproteobacteria bacterium]
MSNGVLLGWAILVFMLLGTGITVGHVAFLLPSRKLEPAAVRQHEERE